MKDELLFLNLTGADDRPVMVKTEAVTIIKNLHPRIDQFHDKNLRTRIVLTSNHKIDVKESAEDVLDLLDVQKLIFLPLTSESRCQMHVARYKIVGIQALAEENSMQTRISLSGNLGIFPNENYIDVREKFDEIREYLQSGPLPRRPSLAVPAGPKSDDGHTL